MLSILLFEVFSLGHQELFQVGAPASLLQAPSFWSFSTFLLSGTTGFSRLIWVFPAPALESVVCSKSRLVSFDPSFPLKMQAVLMVGNSPVLLCGTNQPFANNFKSSLMFCGFFPWFWFVAMVRVCAQPVCLPSLLPNGFQFAWSHFPHSLDWDCDADLPQVSQDAELGE